MRRHRAAPSFVMKPARYKPARSARGLLSQGGLYDRRAAFRRRLESSRAERLLCGTSSVAPQQISAVGSEGAVLGSLPVRHFERSVKSPGSMIGDPSRDGIDTRLLREVQEDSDGSERGL